MSTLAQSVEVMNVGQRPSRFVSRKTQKATFDELLRLPATDRSFMFEFRLGLIFR